MDPSVNEVMRK